VKEEEGDEPEIVYFGAKILSVFFTNIGTEHESHQVSEPIITSISTSSIAIDENCQLTL